jgi:signal transduction histidine kinase
MSGRLQWVACGFAVLGLGQLAFGYIEPILDDSPDLNRSLYEMIFVRTLAGFCFVAGLVPKWPPRFSWRTGIGLGFLCGSSVVGYSFFAERNAVPPVVRIENLEGAARTGITPLYWMTGWHWLLAAPPLGLAILAAVGALWRHRDQVIGSWLPLAIVLLAGSELHDALWPSADGNLVVMTTADVLRLAMAAVVAVGGALELRYIAAERAALLATEQERTGRLEELARLKADFTAMVAHELGYPLSGIRRLTEMLSRDGLDPGLRDHALTAILKETDALDALVADVQATAAVERDDFRAKLRPVTVGTLIDDAVAHVEAHPGRRPVLETGLEGIAARERVLADRIRIGQVMRNLLSNAAKYSPAGAPISLRAMSADGGRVRIEVADRGPGIPSDDQPKLFEKFWRGRGGAAGHEPGAGLGLYLSRRIVRAHGSDLTVRSRAGAGSVFAFELKRYQGES